MGLLFWTALRHLIDMLADRWKKRERGTPGTAA